MLVEYYNGIEWLNYFFLFFCYRKNWVIGNMFIGFIRLFIVIYVFVIIDMFLNLMFIFKIFKKSYFYLIWEYGCFFKNKFWDG